MQERDKLSDSLTHFFKECGVPEYGFPLGDSLKGSVKIPSDSETGLSEAIRISMPLTRQRVDAIRRELKMADVYLILTFALRNSILAVRRNASEQFHIGITALLMDDNLVDWRDKLLVLSLMEDCANRLGLDFRCAVELQIEIATEADKNNIRKGYFKRPAEMRTTKVMGYVPRIGEEGLTYVKGGH